MKMLELESSVKRALASLDFDKYLVAMTVIVDEIAERYRSFSPEPAQALTARTLDLMRAAIANAEGTDTAEATELGREWMDIINEADEPYSPLIHDGLVNLWAGMGSLTGIFVGAASLRETADLIVRAVTTGPGSMYDQDDEIVRLNEMQADENNHTVQMLHKMQAVADLLRTEGDHSPSPQEVKAIVFGH